MAETIGLRAVIDLKNFNKGLSSYNKGLDQMNKKTKQTTKSASSSFAKAGKVFLSVGASVGGLAVDGLIAFGKAAVEEGRAFTKAMSNVGAISGAVGSEFAALETQAKQLGKTTKFTGVEAAEGMTFLAQAGFETVDILSAMPATLDLAAASNLDLGKSADIVSNILTGFGAEANQTGRFVDVLTNTFTTSNTNLSQLGQAMKNVSPVAAKMGLSVETTSAALGKMADAGIQGGAAGTQLKNALLNLAAPSEKQATLQKELGIEIFNTAGEMLSLPQIISNVNEGLSGLGQEQQIAAVKTLAGKRAIAGFQVLLNQGGPALENYAKTLERSGTAAEIAEKQLNNLEGDITLLNSAFSGFKLAAFELMEPALRSASKALTGFLTELNKGADAWTQVFKDVSTIQDWREENVKSALEAGKSYGPYTRQVQLAVGATDELVKANESYIPTASEVAIRSEAQAKALSLVAQESSETVASINSLASASSELVLAETDATQQSVELSRNRSFLVTESDKLAMVTAQIARETAAYEQSQMDAAAAEEARQQTTISLLSTMGTFFSGLQEGQNTAIESEKQFSSSISNIRTTGAEAQNAAATSANDKLVALEEKRAAEEHRILTGGMSRSAAATEAFVQANNAQFQELKDAEIASLNERQEAIAADFSAREGQASAARAKELADQKVHLEELKLAASLATLESTGQLAQFTGGLAISANEAAELIRSGVLPVTKELGAAIQGTLAELGAKEGEVTAQLASNQAILQEAFAGTLEPIEAQALALGTNIPIAAAAAQAATGLANADIVAGAQSAALASQEQDLALQNLGITTFPTLGAAAGIATQVINEGFGITAASIMDNDLALNNITLITLPLLSEIFLVTTTLMIEQLLLLLTTGIMPVDLALMTMYTVTLPTLQAVMIATAAASVAALIPLEEILNILIGLMTELTRLTEEFGKAAEKAGKEAAKGFKDAAKAMQNDLVPAMRSAMRVAEELAAAMKRVVSATRSASRASRSMTGTGFAQGIGFQAGTPSNTNSLLGLGFKIPSGFPNDSFGPMFAQSGEEMLITPKGMSIEGLIFSRLANLLRGTAVQGGSVTNNIVNNFQMNVQTSSTPQAVTRQFEVMQGFVGT